jgi:hypothetical protein
MPYTRVTLNFVGAKKRYETLNGKQYLVVPAVALTEGVHTGSEGPLLYKKEELARNPMAWNHRPVVVYHPVLNGEGVSACDPTVVESQGVGLTFNSSYDGRLKMEAWLEEEKLKRIDSRILDALNNNKMVEVSTGLYHGLNETPGTWNGEAYNAEVVNMQPDHLAVLYDQKGACSIQDGAGLLRNADKTTTELSFEDIRDQIRSCLNPKSPDLISEGNTSKWHWVRDVYSKYAIVECDDKCYKVGYKVRSGKVSIDGEPEEVRKVTSYVTANNEQVQGEGYITMNGQFISNDGEQKQGPLKMPKPKASDLSDPMKRQQMQKALEQHYSGVMQEGDWGGWVTDLYANYAVYSKDGKQFRLPYTYDDDMIRFDGEPEEVERVSEYRRKEPIDGTQSPYSVNQEGQIVATPTITQKHLQTLNRLFQMARDQKLTLNAIHQGAHELLHDPGMGQFDANLPPEHPQSDGQVRTHHPMNPGGKGDSEDHKTQSRKAMVDKLGVHEDDKKWFMDLPDDGWEKVSKYVMKGATEPIAGRYSYEGIGDRSSVHGSHNMSQQTTEQYIANAPSGIREGLMELVASQNAEKTRLVGLITNSRGNRFTPQYLQTLAIPMLRGMADLVQPAQAPRPVMNYGGQADIPMFQGEPQLTNNQQYEPETLQLPVWDFTPQKNGN